MISDARKLAAARRAKSRLARLYAAFDWFKGVGLVPHATLGLCLRVDVAAGAGAAARNIPKEYAGLPVKVVRITGRTPR